MVEVKRKTKVHPLTHRTQWWFVLHANENLLVALEEKWASVHLQTSWKLEPCYKPVDNLQASVSDVAVHNPSPSHSNALMSDPNVSAAAGSINNVNNSALTSTTGELAVNLCDDVHYPCDGIVTGSLCYNNTDASTSMVDNDTAVSEPTIVASQTVSANTDLTSD